MMIVAETIIDGSKIALVNIYAPNDATQQVVFFRDVSKEFLTPMTIWCLEEILTAQLAP